MSVSKYQNIEDESRALIIVVNYNQELEISPFLSSLREVYPQKHIVVVDDGSSDNSAGIAEGLGYQVIRHERNRGVGAAIRTGIEYAIKSQYQFVVIMSSNGKMRTQDLPTVLIPVLNNQADYVTGSRFMKGGGSPGLSSFRRIAIPLFSLFTAPFLGRWFSDITCGFRAYSLKIFEDKRMNLNQEWLDKYELEYYIHYWVCHMPIKVIEVPVVIPYAHLEQGRKSKIKPIVGWWSMIRPFIYLGFGIKR